MTSTELARNPRTQLTITPDQVEFTQRQLAALRTLGVKMYDGKKPGGATQADLAIFFHYAARTGLDPFARQIYLIERMTRDGPRQSIQTGIDGFRLIARRAADAAGHTLGYSDTEWCGQDGLWRDVWLSSTPPMAARVAVKRDEQWFPAVALWSEFSQTYQSGGATKLAPMWARMPASQLAKCAEAAALRKAFPQDLGGLVTDDEAATDTTMPTTQPMPAEPSGQPIQRRTRRPEPEPPPEPEPQLDVVDAEPDQLTELPITEGQRKMLFALLKQSKLSTRDDRLTFINDHLEREITSSNDLTAAEASHLIEVLEAVIEPQERPEQ